jgi:hypothetical protein
MTAPCKQGNEALNSMKNEQFLDQLSNYKVLKTHILELMTDTDQ